MDRNTFIKLRCFLTLDARRRTQYLISKKVFKEVGEHFVFFPRKIPQDPQFIRFHNNVVVATDVMFVNHDIIHEMLNGLPYPHNLSGGGYKKNWGCIEIKDNVFIGARSMIMPGITLGPNVVVAAGSIVTKNFSGGVIIGGNSARVIGSMEKLMKNRSEDSRNRQDNLTKEQEAKVAWERWKDGEQ